MAMTLEEKAKAYDEALARAKNIKSKILQSHLSTESCKAVSEYIDEIIPELRENDGERVAEELIKTFREMSTGLQYAIFLTEEKKQKWISWLEKQKEYKWHSTAVKDGDDDEKIRKKLIALINWSGTPWDGRDKDKFIEYLEMQKPSFRQIHDDVMWDSGLRTGIELEKQKEQKPIDYPYLPGWRKNRDNNKPELKRSVLMLTTHGVAEGEWLGEKWCQYRWSCELKDGEVLYWIHLSDLEQLEKEGEEKQKEQKELPLMDGNADLYFDEWNQQKQNPTKRQCFEEGIRYAQRLQKEQESAEKQDYSGLTDLERAIHRGFLSAGVENVSVTIIKETAKECLAQMKPAEWSEEDERMRTNAVLSLMYLIEECPNADFIDSVKKEIAWLKSLRPQPQWKPSEEQMRFLLSVINEPNNAGSESCHLVLKGLYEQLRNL